MKPKKTRGGNDGCGKPKNGASHNLGNRCAIPTFPPHDYCYIFWENLFPKGAFLTACTSRFRLILRLEKTPFGCQVVAGEKCVIS